MQTEIVMPQPLDRDTELSELGVPASVIEDLSSESSAALYDVVNRLQIAPLRSSLQLIMDSLDGVLPHDDDRVNKWIAAIKDVYEDMGKI